MSGLIGICVVERVVDTVSAIIEELRRIAKVVLIVWSLLPLHFTSFVLAQAQVYAIIIYRSDQFIRNIAIFGEDTFVKQKRVILVIDFLLLLETVI